MTPARTRRAAKAAALIACAALAASCASEVQPKPKVNDTAGKKLQADTKGFGRPAVVFEGDLGEKPEAWATVQPKIGKLSQTFAYDRAGLGKNADVTTKAARSGRQIVHEMRAMLQARKVKPPYLIVGHGFGAYAARLFVSEFPAEIAGLVLIEPLHENFEDALAGILSPEELAQVKRRDADRLAGLSEGARREAEALPGTIDELQASGYFPDVPLVVLAAQSPDAERFKGLPPEKLAKINEVRRELLKSLSLIVADGRFREAKGPAGPRFIADQSDAVAQAILEVVKAAKVRQ